jgi:hypothetical protein
MGSMRLNSVQPIMNWIMQGVIQTDGSETRIPVEEIDGKFAAGLLVPKEFGGFVHSSLQGFLDGKRAEPAPPFEAYYLRRRS